MPTWTAPRLPPPASTNAVVTLRASHAFRADARRRPGSTIARTRPRERDRPAVCLGCDCAAHNTPRTGQASPSHQHPRRPRAARRRPYAVALLPGRTVHPAERPARGHRAGPHRAGRGRRRALRRGLSQRADQPHRLRPPLRAPDVPGLGERRQGRASRSTCRPPAARSTARRIRTTRTTSSCCRPARSSSRSSSKPTGCARRSSPRRTWRTRSRWCRRRSGST